MLKYLEIESLTYELRDMSLMNETFFWYDYELFGLDPKCDRPAQFAGVRTNLELEEIDEPVNIYCKPSSDEIPSPLSCLITGITPQSFCYF